MAEKIQSNLLSEDNLESLRTLVPGDTVDLQIAMPAAPKRVKTDYIGMLIDECLLSLRTAKQMRINLEPK